MTYLCIRPVCGEQCSQCNHAISPQQVRSYALRYAYLRSRDLDAIDEGGVFAGKVPDNVVLNGEDLDTAIDAAFGGKQAAALERMARLDDEMGDAP